VCTSDLAPEIVERVALCATLLDGRAWAPATPRERAALAWAHALARMCERPSPGSQAAVDEVRGCALTMLSEQELSEIANAVERSRARTHVVAIEQADDAAYRQAEVLTIGFAAVVAALLLFTSTAAFIAAP